MKYTWAGRYKGGEAVIWSWVQRDVGDGWAQKALAQSWCLIWALAMRWSSRHHDKWGNWGQMNTMNQEWCGGRKIPGLIRWIASIGWSWVMASCSQVPCYIIAFIGYLQKIHIRLSFCRLCVSPSLPLSLFSPSLFLYLSLAPQKFSFPHTLTSFLLNSEQP